jgi:hypothetical protein
MTSPEISVRMAETPVRHQPKSLYDFNRFACTTPAETAVRFRPFYTTKCLPDGLDNYESIAKGDRQE